VHPEPVVKKSPEVSEPPKEVERQLSKKEKKKKELAELEALLADFGVTQNESNGQDESRGKLAYYLLMKLRLMLFNCMPILVSCLKVQRLFCISTMHVFFFGLFNLRFKKL
jgi:hypothetical protein